MKKILFLIVVCLTIFVQAGCSSSEKALRKKYGNDAPYFLGLKSFDENRREEGVQFLIEAEKKSSPLFARKSLEKLCREGTSSKRIERCLELCKKYPSEESLELAVDELFRQKEYSKVILITDEIDLSSSSNAIVAARLHSLQEKQDIRFSKEVKEWFLTRPYTKIHYSFFNHLKKTAPELFISNQDSEDDEFNPLEMRALVYEKKYSLNLDNAFYVLEREEFQIPMMLSDCGKIFLYGTSDNELKARAAERFLEISNGSSKEVRFYCNFYAGRLLDLDYLLEAAECVSDSEKKDNALWHYFNEKLKISAYDAVDAVRLHGTKICDKYYYDDFFENLSVKLLSQGKYSKYVEAASIVKNFCSSEMRGRYLYVAARLIQEGYANPADSDMTPADLFEKSLECGTDFYYRIMALSQLGRLGEFGNVLKTVGNKSERQIDEEYERLLEGYMDFGLLSHLSAESSEIASHVSDESVIKASSYLASGGEKIASIRTASRRLANPMKEVSEELVRLAYPQFYEKEIKKFCKDFGSDESVIFGLVRSESFFDAGVSSHAGAVGLTQLIPSTAGDVAKKLKVEEYDLRDAETNLMFGTHYFAELTRRLDGNVFLACLSYNTGISRIRSWRKTWKNLPLDLFNEVIPYEESRGYGRKLASSSFMYSYLYESSPILIVNY